ncbi:MAG: D-alanine--D-alanine ligase [Proteobacteria bacterium]|nr:D-alanine--D-alanine ligase [Pseudomonadota bacterium]
MLILHDALPPSARTDEQDALVQAEAVAAALRAGGIANQTRAVGLDLGALEQEVARLQPRLVFNLVESLAQRERLVHLVPTMLDTLGVPYTGCAASAIFQTSDKLVAKRLLAAAGVPTPPWFAASELTRGVALPAARYLLKPIAEHGSVGLDRGALVDVVSADELRHALAARAAAVGLALFAERFIEGREFNLALLAAPDDATSCALLPPAEILFEDFALGEPHIVDYRAKWDSSSHAYHHTPRRFDFPEGDAPLLTALSDLARRCWALFGLGGYARVDFRVDAAGRPWVLEINANPCLSPDAGFAAAAARSGLSFDAMIERIVAAGGRAPARPGGAR